MAIVIVAAVSVGINRSGLLTADILRSGDGTTASASAGDISYTLASGMLIVSSEKIFHDAQSLTFMVVYNPESVIPLSQEGQTSYDFTSSSGKTGNAHITLFLSGTVDGQQNLISIPLSGNSADALISDATILFADGSVDPLAIERK